MATDLLNQVMQGFYGTIRTGQPYYYDIFSYLRRAIATALQKVEMGTRTLQDFDFDKNLQDLAYYLSLTVGSRPANKIAYNNLVQRFNRLTGTNIPTIERSIVEGEAVITTSTGESFTSPRTSGEIAVDIGEDIRAGDISVSPRPTAEPPAFCPFTPQRKGLGLLLAGGLALYFLTNKRR